MNKLQEIIQKYINIKRSKENNQIQLSQELKYKPKSCEDCGRTCLTRRVVYHKILPNLPNHWLHHCNQCRQYWHPETKTFSTSYNGIFDHFKQGKQTKR